MNLSGECIVQDNLLFVKSIFAIRGNKHSSGAPGISRKSFKKAIMNSIIALLGTLRIT